MDKLETYKVGLRATHIDELRKEREKEFAFVDDENTSPLDKLRALRDLQAELYKKEGYTGVLPELYITDEPNSFAVDGKNRETRKIFISLNDLKRGNSSALLYAHENAHLIQTDKDEEIAKYAETKIGENKNKFTENEKEEYISKLKETVKIDKTLEEQFEIARSIPESERENKVYLMARDVNIKLIGEEVAHTSIVLIPDNQEEFFDESKKLKEKYIKSGYLEPKSFGDKLGWIITGFNAEKEKGEKKGKLVIRVNDTTDTEVFNKINNRESNTHLKGEILKEIKHSEFSDPKLIDEIMKNAINYQKNGKYQNYFAIPLHFKIVYEETGEEVDIKYGYNCNSLSNTILRNIGIKNSFEKIDTKRIIPGKDILIPFEEEGK